MGWVQEEAEREVWSEQYYWSLFCSKRTARDCMSRGTLCRRTGSRRVDLCDSNPASLMSYLTRSGPGQAVPGHPHSRGRTPTAHGAAPQFSPNVHFVIHADKRAAKALWAVCLRAIAGRPPAAREMVVTQAGAPQHGAPARLPTSARAGEADGQP